MNHSSRLRAVASRAVDGFVSRPDEDACGGGRDGAARVRVGAGRGLGARVVFDLQAGGFSINGEAFDVPTVEDSTRLFGPATGTSVVRRFLSSSPSVAVGSCAAGGSRANRTPRGRHSRARGRDLTFARDMWRLARVIWHFEEVIWRHVRRQIRIRSEVGVLVARAMPCDTRPSVTWWSLAPCSGARSLSVGERRASSGERSLDMDKQA